MFSNRRLPLILLVVLLSLIIWYSLPNSHPDHVSDDYPAEILQARAQKNATFQDEEDSPLKDPASFDSLSYYPINPEFQVRARLDYIRPARKVKVPNSQGSEEEYLKYARAYFKLNGKEVKLLMLRKSKEAPQLFLAFTDETSGGDTYGGGRYLDIPYQKGQIYAILDFNQAYHPYCLYNEDYVCPIPPRENHIQARIEAGERIDAQNPVYQH